MTTKHETKLLRALWRKAFHGEPTFIKLPDKGERTRVRFMLYAAIRPFREGALHDPELTRAAEECSIRQLPDGLEIVRRDANRTGRALLEALGGAAEAQAARDREVGDLAEVSPDRAGQFSDTLSIAEMEKRLAGLESGGENGDTGSDRAGRSTPYYTREKS